MLPIVVTDLPRLARRIDECHFQVQYHAKGMLLEAKKAGEYLLEAKKLCPHGTFKDWVVANCRPSYDQAKKYHAIVKGWATLEKCPEALFGLSINEAYELVRRKNATQEEPTPAAPATAPSFTREDAEYALKIHARVERGQDGERDVAATKLAKVAEGFGMDPEALVAKAHELCPDAEWSTQEVFRQQAEANERRIQELEAQLEAFRLKVSERCSALKAELKDATREQLIEMIAELSILNEEA